jgi:hypothetical protein
MPMRLATSFQAARKGNNYRLSAACWGSVEFDVERIPYVDCERIVAAWLVEAPAAVCA